MQFALTVISSGAIFADIWAVSTPVRTAEAAVGQKTSSQDEQTAGRIPVPRSPSFYCLLVGSPDLISVAGDESDN